MLTPGEKVPPEIYVLTVILPMQEYHILDLEEQIPEHLVLPSWAQLFTMVLASEQHMCPQWSQWTCKTGSYETIPHEYEGSKRE